MIFTTKAHCLDRSDKRYTIFNDPKSIVFNYGKIYKKICIFRSSLLKHKVLADPTERYTVLIRQIQTLNLTQICDKITPSGPQISE